MPDTKEVKERIRNKIWRAMEESGIARFPKPVAGRIPNFHGAETACYSASRLAEFVLAHTIKINPDTPLTHARYIALKMGKRVIMPTPKLREGFLLIDPSRIPGDRLREASTIRGSFIYGSKISVHKIPRVDLVLVGSVAVNRHGARVGKGGGYADLEYGILRELGLVRDITPVITVVHDIQVIDDEIPMEPHDLPVDLIVTPTRIIKADKRFEKPRGIYWEEVSGDMMKSIPILREIRGLSKR